MDELSKLRLRGALILAAFGWAWTGALLLLALVAHLNNPWLTVLLSAAINILPTLSALRGRYDVAVGLMFGFAAAVQPALLVYLMTGHPWQMEAHMYFFVGLAGLTLLCDWRPIAVAVAATAVHHLLLSYVAPEWVFIGSGDLPRVMVHALAVSLVLAVLGPVMVHMGKLFIKQSEGRAESDFAAAAAQEALAETRLAQEAVEIEREKRLEAERRANNDARRQELIALGAEFENSVSKFAESVGAAAEELERSARDMHRIAHGTGQLSENAVSEAQAASRSAVQVSTGISELSKSIATIAARAQQQAALGELGRTSSLTGEAVISALSERSGNIETFIELIEGVASQTNLLALNATIEAARAGDAGRSFAVVASEVKVLAKKAKGATVQITEIVSDVDAGATEAGQVITKVSQAMGDLATGACAMQAEINDQRNVAQMIDYNAARSAAGADLMAERVSEVARSSIEAAEQSEKVQSSAASLTQIAYDLQKSTGQFLGRLRAA